MSRARSRPACTGPAPLLLAVVLALATPPAVRATPGFERVDVHLPGPLLSAVAARGPDGAPGLAVLVGPPEEANEDDGEEGGTPSDDEDERPRSLLWIDAGVDLRVDLRRGDTAEAALLADDLSPTAHRVTTVRRSGEEEAGDPSDLLVVVDDEGLTVLDPGGSPGSGTLRRSGTAAGGTLLPTEGLAPDPSGLLATARPGTLELLAAAPEGHLTVAESLELPKRAERKRWGVRISSPKVHRLRAESVDAPPPCWAVGPEAHGKRRLRTLLYCTDRADPIEVWSLLPGGDTVTATLFTRYPVGKQGRPLLVALTREKLGPFVEQGLRVFPLEASRNRVGSDPLFTVETDCPLWRGSALGFADADGDGREDLYLLCEKGMIDQELRIETYRYLGGGRFEDRPRDLNLDGSYSSWAYGPDWTGDGLPDLLAVREGVLELHPGTDGRRRPVESRAEWILDLRADADADDREGDFEVTVEVDTDPDGDDPATVRLGGPRLLDTLDLTGDARHEIVIHRRGEPGGVITILTPC